MIEIKSNGVIFQDHRHIKELNIKLHTEGNKSGQRWFWRKGSDDVWIAEANLTRFWHTDALTKIVEIWVDAQ